MNAQEKLSELAERRHGILKTSDVVAAGISKATFSAYLKKNGYEKASHGIYCAPDAWEDRMYLLQLRCPKVIFSHETALFLHDLTDQEPLHYSVTVQTGYNPAHLTAEGIQVYTVKQSLLSLGKTEWLTPFGNSVQIYDLERTICDVVRSRNSLEARTLHDALRQYTRRRDKNLLRLMEYAEQLRVQTVLRQYLEVLL